MKSHDAKKKDLRVQIRVPLAFISFHQMTSEMSYLCIQKANYKLIYNKVKLTQKSLSKRLISSSIWYDKIRLSQTGPEKSIGKR